jgi:hypothetical protein
MQVSTDVFEDLAAKVAELDGRLREVTRLHEIVLHGPGTDGREAGARQVGKPATPKRDRHGLRAIAGGKR